MLKWLVRIVVVAVIVFIAVLFGLLAYNFYRNYVGVDDTPPVIYERSDRPSRA